MSYDLYLFKLHDGVTVEDVNEFLASEAYQEYIKRDDPEDDDYRPVLPGHLVDTSMSEDTLRFLAGKAYLKVIVPEDERSEELIEYLESDDDEAEVPEEWEEAVMMAFEYAGSDGILPVPYSYGGNLDEAVEEVARILDELGDGFAVYDPQTGKATDSMNSRVVLGFSAEESTDKFKEIVRQLNAGEVELFSLDDLEKIENENEDLDEDDDKEDDGEEENEGKKGGQ